MIAPFVDVGVNPITRYDNFTIAGPAYLGPSYEPFAVLGDPSQPGFKVPNVPIAEFATQDLSFDVANEHGAQPVWVSCGLWFGDPGIEARSSSSARRLATRS